MVRIGGVVSNGVEKGINTHCSGNFLFCYAHLSEAGISEGNLIDIFQKGIQGHIPSSNPNPRLDDKYIFEVFL